MKKETMEERFDKLEGIDWDYIYELKRLKTAELEVSDFEETDAWLPIKLKAFISQEIQSALKEKEEEIMKVKGVSSNNSVEFNLGAGMMKAQILAIIKSK